MLHFPANSFVTTLRDRHHRQQSCIRARLDLVVCLTQETALCFENTSQECPRRRGQSLITTTERSERNRPFSWPQVSIGHGGLTMTNDNGYLTRLAPL